MRFSRVRSVVLVVVLGLLGAACGDLATTTSQGGVPPGSTGTTAPSVTSSSDITQPTTSSSVIIEGPPGPEPEDLSALDAVLVDRSVLSLGLHPTDPRSGRFRIVPGDALEGFYLKVVGGRYWVTDSGNVYTALDVDPELIAAEMARLAELVAGAVEGMDDISPYAESLREHYRGDEFQIGLADFVLWLFVGPLSQELAEPYNAWAEPIVGDDLSRCREQIESFDAASRDWVRHLDIEFTEKGGALVVDLSMESVVEAVVAQGAANADCPGYIGRLESIEAGSSPELRITLTPGPDRRLIEVSFVLPDTDSDPVLTLVMWPDTSVGDSPPTPSPAPLLTLQGSYLTAISVCGELPWTYLAGPFQPSYHHPDADDNFGPFVYTSDWLCDYEVPEDER